MHFYLEGRNVINKKGLFCAKFFEFEEFFWPSFFWVASSLSILWLQTVSDTKELQVTLLVASQSKSLFRAVAYPTMARFFKNPKKFQPDAIWMSP